jgi:serine protease Do
VGIGFAIPSEIASRIVDELLAKGHVDRGWLGVDLDTTVRRRPGAAIAAVNRGGPAARGGLRPGDVVTAINGERVENTRELIRDVSAVNPGMTAHLRVHRGTQTLDLAVVLGRRPPEPPQPETEPDQ